MRWFILALLFASGCMFFFDDHGSRPDTCDLAAPAVEPPQLRDPDSLVCTSFGSPCNPACGPCPPETGFAPAPTWGVCGSECEALAEFACASNPLCRVVKDARCVVGADCVTDFIGCFPTDTLVDTTIDCLSADAWACSRNNGCTALHKLDPCPLEAGFACPRSFAMCVREGMDPGRCFEPVVCDAVEPSCPTGKTPGIANGCYTGACIPIDLCVPQ